MIDKNRLESYGVQNVLDVLPNEGDLVTNAAVEILVANYEHNIATPNIEPGVVNIWCAASHIEFTDKFATDVAHKARELYVDESFRKNVFLAIHNKWLAENKNQ